VTSAVASRLDSIRDRGGIKSREVAQLLDTTPQTVSRWRTGKVEPQPDRLQRLLTLEWLLAELAEFYEPDEAHLWLFSPHRLLSGERPADRIQQGKLNDVLALIAQLRDGAYV
jgi:transcriptional regulator with XRE-family HTH domain